MPGPGEPAAVSAGLMIGRERNGEGAREGNGTEGWEKSEAGEEGGRDDQEEEHKFSCLKLDNTAGPQFPSCLVNAEAGSGSNRNATQREQLRAAQQHMERAFQSWDFKLNLERVKQRESAPVGRH